VQRKRKCKRNPPVTMTTSAVPPTAPNPPATTTSAVPPTAPNPSVARQVDAGRISAALISLSTINGIYSFEELKHKELDSFFDRILYKRLRSEPISKDVAEIIVDIIAKRKLLDSQEFSYEELKNRLLDRIRDDTQMAAPVAAEDDTQMAEPVAAEDDTQMAEPVAAERERLHRELSERERLHSEWKDAVKELSYEELKKFSKAIKNPTARTVPNIF